MFLRNWKKEIFTIPNLLSLLRLLLIPVYIRIYRNATELHQFQLAGFLATLSCLTDLMDGVIARHFHMISNVGKVLDPLADKLTQLSLFLCLYPRYPVLYPVIILFLIKELFQLSCFLIHIQKKQALPGALYAGKICTSILFTSLIAMLLFPDMQQHTVHFLVLTDIFFLVLSFGCYVLAYFGPEPKLRDLEADC